MSKRIMIITQWFDPEPTFKGLLFAKELVARGFDVIVITGFPNYPGGKIYPEYRLKFMQKEYIEGVSIVRVPLFPSHGKSKIGRIVNYISFMLTSFIYGLFLSKKTDLIYAYHPPLTVGLSAIFIKLFRRIPIVYDIQDMWPDTLNATGMISNKHILNCVSKICSLIYKKADKLVVLSPGFKKQLIARGVNSEKIKIIYNWADEEVLRKTDDNEKDYFSSTSKFNILFAGNIGQAQGLDIVLEAADIIRSDCDNIYFWIIGDGLEQADLKKRAKKLKLENVRFFPAVNMNKIGPILRSADALFIHLKRDPLFKITIPGKTQAYMAVGKPIIMGVQGDAGNLIKKAKCGIIIEPEDAFDLSIAAKKMANFDRSELSKMSSNAIRYYDKNLSVRVGVDAFADIFKNL